MEKSQRAFTLVELLVVITIIAILSAIGLVNYTQVTKSGRDAKRLSDLKQVQSALEQYFADQFFYPSQAVSPPLTFGSAFSNSTGNPNPPVIGKTYLNALPCDPTTGNCSPDITGIQYCYLPLPAGCNNNPTTKCLNYKLYAKLENLAEGNGECGGYNKYNLEVTRP